MLLHWNGSAQQLSFFKGLLSKLPAEPEFFVTMVKMLGIAYIAEFSSSICKDCGHSAIASQIELFAKGAIVVMSIPVMSCLIELIGELFLICKKIYFDNNHIGCSVFAAVFCVCVGHRNYR